MICASSNCWGEADSELFYVTTSDKPGIVVYYYCPEHYPSKIWANRECSAHDYFETRLEAEAELISRILLYETLPQR